MFEWDEQKRAANLAKQGEREDETVMGKRDEIVIDDAENPEWTADDFARARPSHEIPELAAVLRRGRPPLPEDERKQRVTMYLDRDLVERLKQDGKGWQTRANALLRKAAGL